MDWKFWCNLNFLMNHYFVFNLQVLEIRTLFMFCKGIYRKDKYLSLNVCNQSSDHRNSYIAKKEIYLGFPFLLMFCSSSLSSSFDHAGHYSIINPSRRPLSVLKLMKTSFKICLVNPKPGQHLIIGRLWSLQKGRKLPEKVLKPSRYIFMLNNSFLSKKVCWQQY